MKSIYCIEHLNKPLTIFEVSHSNVTYEELLEIVDLKMTVWKYPKESQLEWIKQNVYNEDIHYLMYNKDMLIAYLCVCAVNLKIGENCTSVFGLSNVCVRNNMQKMGLGTLIVNKILEKYNNNPVLLLTTYKNVSFYEKIGFNRYSGNLYIMNKIDENTICFFKNIDLNYENISIDRSF